MPVIDLGDVTAGAAAADPDVPRPRPARRLGTAAVTALCAFTLGAATTVPPPAVRLAWELPVEEPQSITLAGDTAFVHRMAGAQAVLTAYDVADGEPKWSLPTGPDLGAVEAIPGTGVVLMRSGPVTVEKEYADGTTGALMFHRETVALAPATGDTIWRRPGEPLTGGPDGVLLEQRDRRGEIGSLSLVRGRDGAPLWSVPTPGLQNIEVGYRAGRPRLIVTASDRGEITVLRYADGRPLRNLKSPWLATQPSAGYETDLVAAGDRLLLVRMEAYRTTITAHQIETLQELWRATVDPFPWIHDCGVVLCLVDDNSLAGLDPATGRRRWQLPGIVSISWSGGGRLLAADSADPPVQRLVDAADGRLIGPGGTGYAHSTPSADNSVLLLRTAAAPSGHTAVSRLDLRTGRPKLIGLMHVGHQFGCDAAERHLLCRAPDRLVVTAVD